MKKIIVPGLTAGVVILILGMVISYIFMPFPSIRADYNSTSVIMRSWADPLISLFLLYPFVLGVALAWFWDKSKHVFKGSFIKRGFGFGFAYFVIATIPGMLISYSSLSLSLLTIISWAISGFINAVAAGMIFAKMDK